MPKSFTSSAQELKLVNICEASNISPANSQAVKDPIIALKF